MRPLPLVARAGSARGALLVALGVWLLVAACGGSEVREPRPAAAGLWYSAVSLPGQPVDLWVVSSGPRALVVVEMLGPVPGEGERGGVVVGALSVSADGGSRTPLVTVAAGWDRLLGEPVVDGGGLLVGGSRDLAGSPGRSLLEVVRWDSSGTVGTVLSCELPELRRGQVAVDDGVLAALLGDGSGPFRGFRTPLAEATCPGDGDWSELPVVELPEDYRIDWVGDAWAVSAQWGETLAIQLFGRRLEPLRRLRLASGAAVATRDLSFQRRPGGEWFVTYVARVAGAYDVYMAPLGQWRAGPLADERIVGTAEIERRPRLVERSGRTIAHWSVVDRAAGEWIELAAVVPSRGTALPGGEVVWRRPLGADRLGRTAWTDLGLLRVSVGPGRGGHALLVSPYRPSFW